MINQSTKILSIFKSDISKSFLITFILFGVCGIFVGWWTDSYQYMVETGISGDAVGFAMSPIDPLPEYMPGASWIFTYLTEMYQIRWVAYFLYVILFISIWVIYYNLYKVTNDIPLINRILIFIFFSFLFCESVILHHMVRVTMFAGVAGLSKILFIQDDDKNKYKMFSIENIPYLALFTLALWIRCNVHLFTLTFLAIAFLIHKKSLKPLVPYIFLFCIFFAYYVKVVFLTDYGDDLYFGFLYNMEFKLHFTGEYTPDLHLNNQADSIKYDAIKLEFLGDENNLNKAFFERVGVVSNHSRFSYSQAIYALGVFVYSMKQNIYFLIADIFLIFSYVVFGGAETKNYKTKTFLLFIAFYAVLFGICFIKMENRFLVPFQILFLLTILVFHKPNIFYSRRYTAVFLVFILAFIPLVVYFTQHKVHVAKSQHENYDRVFTWLSDNYPDHIVVVNTTINFIRKPNKLFLEDYNFKELYYYNAGSRHLSPAGRIHIESNCHCSAGDYYPFYDYLAQSAPKVLLLDHPKRIRMLELYLDKINHKNHKFEMMSVPEDVQKALYLQGYMDSLSIYKQIY